MKDRIGGSPQYRDDHQGIFKRLTGHDIPWTDIFLQQAPDTETGVWALPALSPGTYEILIWPDDGPMAKRQIWAITPAPSINMVERSIPI